MASFPPELAEGDLIEVEMREAVVGDAAGDRIDIA
jgi:hypothetical protein